MDKERELAKVGLFSRLDRRILKHLAGICVEKTWPAGTRIFRQGENGIGLYIIVSGRVGITKSGPGGVETDIAECGPGEILGEMSVLDGAPRSANADALGTTTCLVLAAWEFESFLRTNPGMVIEILRVVVARYRETNAVLLGMLSSGWKE